ncbi:tetratricopeptide repeat protein [Saprospira grandis]|uniref:TPR domain protein n=1 Tax=Saprospira grandis (strain Lewin) TaxID=984262 RepID=H6L8D3_SAPGL|nr:hypothetical protein [Saprospira grandis]AFC26497.1 TPR domain protein [Saprospira grandis str. Lewin]
MKMKQYLAIAAFVGMGVAVQAQNNLRTSAFMDLMDYSGAPAKKGVLERAKTNIDKVVLHEKTKDDVKSWKYKGQIYHRIASDAELGPKYPNAAIECYDAYEKALSMAEAEVEAKGKPKSKIKGKGDFRTGFKNAGIALYNTATAAFNGQDWTAAYENFRRVAAIPERTAAFDPKGKIDLTFEAAGNTVDMVSNARFLGGLAAVSNKKSKEAEALLLPALEKGSLSEANEQTAYSKLALGYFNEGNTAAAKTILKKGRDKYATNFDLLIAEINIALAEGRLAELESELKQAVEADKENVELHFVLGNMYDELFRKALEKAETDKAAYAEAKSYFEKAVKWYEKTKALKADHFNSLYSLGAIYVNHSNYFVLQMKGLSLKEKEKGEALQKEYMSYLDEGLARLLEAEKVNPDDLGLIRALKEVYTRKNDDANWKKYNDKEKSLR